MIYSASSMKVAVGDVDFTVNLIILKHGQKKCTNRMFSGHRDPVWSWHQAGDLRTGVQSSALPDNQVT